MGTNLTLQAVLWG